jgi:hypothetical protein
LAAAFLIGDLFRLSQIVESGRLFDAPPAALGYAPGSVFLSACLKSMTLDPLNSLTSW